MRKKGFKYFLMMIFCVLLITTAIPTESIAQRDRDDRNRNDETNKDYDRNNDRNQNNDRRYKQCYSKNQVTAVIREVEENSKRFRRDLDRDLDRSRIDGTRREDQINEDVKNFESAFNTLRSEFDNNAGWWESRNQVQIALDSARPVTTRLRNNQFGSNVQAQWRNLRASLNRLAVAYNLPSV